ncbi:hypothetical protein Anapl_03512 [Anas platyrhynchos]|uniref:Uncharacterized protein n=1 Tax=Anas platyrhynchos TaxID=8839 RepID=R0LTN7_ANAPL|nr:hypothetical protein Anapl_03512 [Anas platyrhynchos]
MLWNEANQIILLSVSEENSPLILSIVPAGTLLEPPYTAWFPMPNPDSRPQKILWGTDIPAQYIPLHTRKNKSKGFKCKAEGIQGIRQEYKRN